MKKRKCVALKNSIFLLVFMVMVCVGNLGIVKAASSDTETVVTATANVTATSSVSVTNQIIDVSVTDLNVTGANLTQLDLHFINPAGSDVYTVAATKVSDTAFSASVDASALNPQYGTYTVTAVANVLLADGVTTSAVNIESKASVELVAAYGTGISAGSPDKKAGTFVVTSGAVYGAGGIADVSIVVTSKKNATKTHTYSGLTADASGNYSVKADVADLSYTFGEYTLSTVVTLADGTTHSVATGGFKFSPSDFIRYGETDRKKLTKTIYIYNPKKLKDVKATVWSKKGKEEDLDTYSLKKKNGHLEFTINMNKLRYSGTIYIKLTKKSNNKEIKTVSFEAKKKDIVKNGWYYEKASDKKKYKFYYKNGKKVNNLTEILDIKEETKLHIQVNRKKNRVTVFAYDEDTDKWCIPVISFICSVGVNTEETLTPTGTYKSDRKHRWKALMEESWGQYATHIVRGVYFHSVAGSTTDSYGISAYAYNRLGQAASHGCIRLTVRDAKWIYDYCAIGSEIKIGDWDFEGPLKPQKVEKIPVGQHYDPTDPAVKKK